MRFNLFSLIILTTTLLGGCATHSDLDGIIPKERNPLVQHLAHNLIQGTLDFSSGKRARERCVQQNTSRRTSADRVARICRGAAARKRASDARLEKDKEHREYLEDKARAAALEQSFKQRKTVTDTADIIIAVRRNNDWMIEGKDAFRSVVIMEKPDELD